MKYINKLQMFIYKESRCKRDKTHIMCKNTHIQLKYCDI